ncbi:MAG: hypothetical protein MJK04_29665 [Psychrosphaera sp.]|nr:hypothetical protein [Psychrosphaera sp.]
MKELTKIQETALQKLTSLPDVDIDTSDIPELTAQQLATAQVGHFYKPIKQLAKPITDA